MPVSERLHPPHAKKRHLRLWAGVTAVVVFGCGMVAGMGLTYHLLLMKQTTSEPANQWPRRAERALAAALDDLDLDERTRADALAAARRYGENMMEIDRERDAALALLEEELDDILPPDKAEKLHARMNDLRRRIRPPGPGRPEDRDGRQPRDPSERPTGPRPPPGSSRQPGAPEVEAPDGRPRPPQGEGRGGPRSGGFWSPEERERLLQDRPEGRGGRPPRPQGERPGEAPMPMQNDDVPE